MLPSLRALKSAFNAEIILLTKPGLSDLYKNNPSVGRIMMFEDNSRHKGLFGRLKLVSELRKEKFDLAVVYHNCFDAALHPFLAGIPERIGYVREGRKPLLTRSLSFPKDPIHMVEHFFRVLGLIGVAPINAGPEFFLSEDEKEKTLALLSDLRRPYIGIIPGSIAPTRRWFPERFAGVSERLSAETGGNILILGGPGDKAISEKIKRLMKSPSVDFTGRLSLRDLICVLSACDLVISNDTGPMHIAAVLQKPVVTFIGVADMRKTMPLGSKVHVIRKEVPCSPCIKEECPRGDNICLRLIEEDEVYEAAKALLLKHADFKRRAP